MDIVRTKEGGALVIALEGRLDTNTSPQLEAAFAEDAEGVTQTTLDLERLAYLSSAGLRVILAMQKKMNGVSGSLTVKNVNDAIMEVFEITGFSDILTIE